MPPDKENFRTECSRAGFLCLAFLAGATDHPTAMLPAAQDRHAPSMHDIPLSCSTAAPPRADGRRWLEIRRAWRETALPAGVITAAR